MYYKPIKVKFILLPQRVPPANTGFALYMYHRQFMSRLCTQAPVCVGALPAYIYIYIYTASIAGIYLFKCVPVPVPVQTFVPVPDASVSSVRHQYWQRKLP